MSGCVCVCVLWEKLLGSSKLGKQNFASFGEFNEPEKCNQADSWRTSHEIQRKKSIWARSIPRNSRGHRVITLQVKKKEKLFVFEAARASIHLGRNLDVLSSWFVSRIWAPCFHVIISEIQNKTYKVGRALTLSCGGLSWFLLLWKVVVPESSPQSWFSGQRNVLNEAEVHCGVNEESEQPLSPSPTCQRLEVHSPFSAELISKKQESSQANYSLKHVSFGRPKIQARYDTLHCKILTKIQISKDCGDFGKCVWCNKSWKTSCRPELQQSEGLHCWINQEGRTFWNISFPLKFNRFPFTWSIFCSL